ncbi:MAG TPA: hypothetical protein VIL29_01360, partial [Pseudothermotoga sp.]
MIEGSLNQVILVEPTKRSSLFRKAYIIFLSGYVLLSGFVFIEPSPAEVWFLIFIPFLLVRFKTTFQLLLIFALLFFPMLISTYIGYTVSGYCNPRFVFIDIYLFSFFLLVASWFNTAEKEPVKSRNSFLNLLMKVWALAGSINILAGFIVYLTGSSLLPVNIIRFGIRLQGFFKDPNVLGPFLVPIAVYSLKGFLEGGKNKIIKLFIFLFFSLGVVLTFSRAAWLNYAMTLLFYLFYAISDRKTFKRSIVFMILITLFFVSFLYLSSYIYIFNTNLGDFLLARSRLQSYDEARFETQSMFFDILSSTSILFGTGPGNYESFAGMATHS